jgi:hypothetical protein
METLRLYMHIIWKQSRAPEPLQTKYRTEAKENRRQDALVMLFRDRRQA